MSSGFKAFQEATRNKSRAAASLPPPPTGQAWKQDLHTKEWKLVVAASSNSGAEKTNNNNNNPIHNNMVLIKTSSAASKNRMPPSPRSSSMNSKQPQSPLIKKVVLDQLPNIQETSSSLALPPRSGSISSSQHKNGNNLDQDWDLLSDRFSQASGKSQQGTILISSSKGAGSVRSIADILIDEDDNYFHHYDSSNNNNDHPDDERSRAPSFKIQRTHSNSTIDSHEYDADLLGPTGKGVLGVDYVEHVILPTDTLQGICLAYKISVTKLRQANHFSGNSLLLAPKKLVIPLSKKALRAGYLRVQDTDAKEYKLYNFLAEFTNFQVAEAKAYLELADWNLKDAKQSAQEDLEWEREFADADATASLKAGEIRITTNTKKKGLVLSLQGAGIGGKTKKTPAATVTPEKKPIVYARLPEIATKSVQAKDVYHASPQHDNYGVELKDIAARPVSP
mmetsp:Transcript_17301/g.37773  ORF Transcript_17301/g.37773 Transcript_17301/m.37773 type:complete len:451 (+) Transcript_17301:159-1511(+)